jgi:hypothetical protein
MQKRGLLFVKKAKLKKDSTHVTQIFFPQIIMLGI